MQNTVSALFLSVTLALLPLSARATTIIDFESLATPVDDATGGTYTEDGFQLVADVMHPSVFVIWGTTSVNFPGSTALGDNVSSGVTTLSKIGGGTFDLISMDLSELFNLSSYDPIPVEFTGHYSGGGTASLTVNLDLVFGFETFDFGSLFNDVDSVSWIQHPFYHQFDNLVIEQTPSAVPEPATLALLGIGLLGLGALRRRRIT